MVFRTSTCSIPVHNRENLCEKYFYWFISIIIYSIPIHYCGGGGGCISVDPLAASHDSKRQIWKCGSLCFVDGCVVRIDFRSECGLHSVWNRAHTSITLIEVTCAIVVSFLIKSVAARIRFVCTFCLCIAALHTNHFTCGVAWIAVAKWTKNRKSIQRHSQSPECVLRPLHRRCSQSTTKIGVIVVGSIGWVSSAIIDDFIGDSDGADPQTGWRYYAMATAMAPPPPSKTSPSALYTGAMWGYSSCCLRLIRAGGSTPDWDNNGVVGKTVCMMDISPSVVQSKVTNPVYVGVLHSCMVAPPMEQLLACEQSSLVRYEGRFDTSHEQDSPEQSFSSWKHSSIHSSLVRCL